MFNNDDQKRPVPVRLALNDGRMLDGKLMLPPSIDVKRVLNGDGAILEFVNLAGATSLVAKSAIVEIMPVAPGKPKTQSTAASDDVSEARAILGIAVSATAEQARTAFDMLKLQYHPNRFASIDLPNDVLEFIGVKSRRIDAAYALIGSPVAGEKVD